MRFIPVSDDLAVSRWAARYIVDKVQKFAPTAARPFVLGLPTGGTAIAVYQELVRHYNEGEISFAHVVTFNMDEYVGLAADHPQSYHFFMQRHLFDHVDISPDNIHFLDGTEADLVQECQRYEKAIEDQGGIDLFLGGVGQDGHIAFNEPASSLASRTRIKSLTPDTLKANARFFDNNVDLVPKLALTVGVGTVLAAREVVIVDQGGIDLFLGGVGQGGHIAFNEPASSLASRTCLLYTSPSPRDRQKSRMPSSA